MEAHDEFLSVREEQLFSHTECARIPGCPRNSKVGRFCPARLSFGAMFTRGRNGLGVFLRAFLSTVDFGWAVRAWTPAPTLRLHEGPYLAWFGSHLARILSRTAEGH